MCGIGGYWGDGNSECLDAMTQSMHHRGPDDSGIWTNGQVGLANVRLAIQDLSSAGHMPMTDGKCWITYNGEIYNFIQLRTELQGFGYVFRSVSDTEVILAAFQEWGFDCVHRFRGMFAFAIYNPVDGGQLFIARDHFGIKPLYWTQVKKTFLFASEIRSLLATGFVRREVDSQAAWDYLSIGSVIPPLTIIKGVNSLRPGHAMLIQSSGIRTWRWWNIVEAAAKVSIPTSFEEAVRETRYHLEQSVKLQMAADVPVGAFLSGGIDSTTIVGLMSSVQQVHTYSVAFKAGKYSTSELPYAEVVSRKFNTLHEEIVYTEADIAHHFDQIIASLDQPSVDGVNTYVVSQAARRDVTVSLSGLGADELFAGYPHFKRFQEAAKLVPYGNKALKESAIVLSKVLPGRLRLKMEFFGQTAIGRHMMIRRLFNTSEKISSISPDLFGSTNNHSTEDFYAEAILPNLDTVSQTSYVEIQGYMTHTLLRDVDNMSMAHSLEVRVPFLDADFAQFIFALPSEWKLKKSKSKVILKQAVNDLVPHDILVRPKKGFDLPTTAWIQGVLCQRVQEIVELGVEKGILQNTILSQSGWNKTPHLIWPLAILISWIDCNKCSWV